jgi:urocanate hydratase
MFNVVAFFLIICAVTNAFSGVTTSRQLKSQTLKMAGYLPDGMTQKQWDAIQKAEKEQKTKKGASGTTKFRSRSFEAWQKAGLWE